MSSPADAAVSALRSGHDELVALVADLDLVALTGPSAAAEWDVASVLSHLGSAAEIGLGQLHRALDPSVPEVPNAEIWDRWNARSPLEQLTGFLSTEETLVEAYEALDQQARTDLRIDLGFLPAPADVALAAGFRLAEQALHSWDVRSAFDPAATVSPEATPLLLDHVGMMLGWIGKADALDRSATLLVETSDPVRRFALTIGDAVAVGEADTNDDNNATDGTLSLPAEAWLRLTSGRLAPDRTPLSVVLSSDTVTLDDLRRVFPGF